MKQLQKIALTLLLGVGAYPLYAQEEPHFELPKIAKPSFTPDTVSIVAFGAVAGGDVLNTEPIAKAIEACSRKGGVVLVPRGLWLTGPIVLRSNVNLHLQKGAVLQFSASYDDYPLVDSYFEGWQTVRCQSPISAKQQTNIAITGAGIIDGAGGAWRPVKRSKMTPPQWKELIASGGVLSSDKNTWYPTQKSLLGATTTLQGYIKGGSKADYERIKEYLRPNMVALVECTNVLLEGVTFQNSPAWNIHPLMCRNLIVDGVNIRNPWYAQNGDGIDVESCSGGMIVNSTFDVGDDAICIKSGKDEEGRKRGLPTENFLIENNIVYHGHGGFVVGSEMSGGVRNLVVRGCSFMGTDIGLRFKSTRGRGGVVENIYIDGINMVSIATDAISLNLYYEGKSPVAEPEDDGTIRTTIKEVGENPIADESTPTFRNIVIKNVSCKGAGRAIYIEGLPEKPVSGILLQNVNIQSRSGIRCVEASQVVLDGVKVGSMVGVGLELNNIRGLETKNCQITTKGGKAVVVHGSASHKISLTGVQNISNGDISIDKEVPKDVVICSKK